MWVFLNTRVNKNQLRYRGLILLSKLAHKGVRLLLTDKHETIDREFIMSRVKFLLRIYSKYYFSIFVQIFSEWVWDIFEGSTCVGHHCERSVTYQPDLDLERELFWQWPWNFIQRLALQCIQWSLTKCRETVTESQPSELTWMLMK